LFSIFAIFSILDQYVETHFEIARISEKYYNAELLYNMYKDETNVLYLLFLKPHVTFNKLIKHLKLTM